MEVFTSSEELDLLLATGYRKPVTSLTTGDRSSLSDALLDYHLMAKVKTEMDQFCEGLDTFGTLGMLRSNPSLWEPYFIHANKDLSPGIAIYTCTF